MRILVPLCILVGSLWVSPLAAATDDFDRLRNDAVSGSQEVRLRALHQLGQSGDLRAVPILLNALHNTSAAIRKQAAEALRALAQTLRGLSEMVAQWLEQVLANLEAVLTSPPSPEVEWTRHRHYF